MAEIFDKAAYAAKARATVPEGSVLLRNEGVLPFAKGTRVAVFGRSQYNYYKSGTGSGGLVNTAPVMGITAALQDMGDVTVDAQVEAVYQAWLQDHPFDVGQGWAAEPWYQEEMPLEPEMVKAAAGRNDAALVILGRTAGEDKDNSAAEGSYLLAQAERDVLKAVCAAFKKVAVVLNTGSILDMSWVETYRPGAVLYVWQGGQEGGKGAADVLTGRAFPSGRLPDTIAKSIEDYPAAGNFGSESRNIYAEDIYVGYRYFETFAPDKVLYPFGFGLSYTTFDTSGKTVEHCGDTLRFSATVRNTGSAPGKEVVQVYCQAPQGKLGKPVRSLCAFGKTRTLKPGEAETLTMECPVASLASYDDSGVTGRKSSWVLEAGDYKFFIGSDVRSASCAGTVALKEAAVETLEEVMAPVLSFERLRPGTARADGVFEKASEPAPLGTVDPMVRRSQLAPREIPQTGDRGIKLIDVYDGKAALEDFIAQLTDEDLICIIRGEGMCSPKVTPGTAGAFGGVTDELLALGIPTGCCADGPSGIRMDCGTRAFAMPNGTLMASSFNLELVRELYEFEGLELRKNKIDALLGPGINIHRHPLNGRNFEYFSEDPLLTGKMAAAQLHAMQKYGVTGVIKHFFCNSQEFHRHDVEAVVSERAIREIYLKAFEIAVKEGGARAIMTSYNPVNSFWSASNYDLNTTVLRSQWGYQGLVMTDWWAMGNDPGKLGERSNVSSQVRAQNDLNMVNGDSKTNSNGDNLNTAMETGAATRAEFQRSAMNICRFLLQSPALQRLNDRETELDHQLDQSQGMEDEDMGKMYTVALENGAGALDVSTINAEKGGNTRFTITTKDPGLYTLSITVRSTDDNDVSQIPFSVFQDRTLLLSHTVIGSEREWKTLEIPLQPSMSAVFYLRFFFAQTGIEIKEASFKLTKTMQELMAEFAKMHEQKEEE